MSFLRIHKRRADGISKNKIKIAMTLLKSGRRPPNCFLQPDHWYRSHLADLVERRDVETRGTGHSKVTYTARPKPALPAIKPRMPTPEVMSRPPGMTRQVQRALYRRACKIAGVPFRQQ